MKYKILNTAGTLAIGMGLVLILGAVGAMDCDTYTIKEGLIQVAIATGMVLCGLLAKAAVDNKGGKA